MATLHSIIPPSASGIWRYCTGWVTFNQRYPSGPAPLGSPRSVGSAGHWAGAELIRQELGITDQAAVTHDPETGEAVTPEMLEAAEFYADHVADQYYRMADQGPVQYGIEETIPIHAVHPECFGTPDFWAYSEKLDLLYIPDFKTGHIKVDAEENQAGICYAAGLSRKLPTTNETKVVIEIVGPRMFRAGGPVSTWKCTYRDLLFYIGKLTVAAAKAVNGIEAELKTGLYCRYCDHVVHCEPAIRAGLDLFEQAERVHAIDLSMNQNAALLAMVERGIEQLKGVQTGLSEVIETAIKSGQVVPGWGLKPTQGRERWTDERAAVGAAALYGVDIAKPGVLTPNQARKKGLAADLVAMYATRESGFSLTQTSRDALKAFGKQWEK